MTATRALLALTLLAGLGACAGAPRIERMPEIVAEPPAPAAPTLAPTLPEPALAMEMCRTITIENEIVDFTEMDAEPTFETRRIVAEFPMTTSEQARGMQYRIDPHPDTAMLFEFAGDHNPAMWMKDTPASLDMIFISEDGAAFYIEAGTEPGSELFLTPEEPDPVARYVLEVPAGGSERLGITPGFSTLEFGPAEPCAAYFHVA